MKNKSNLHHVYSILFLLTFLLPPSLQAAPRDIQIASVNFATSVVEVKNFGSSTELLDGWRFCSHNTSQFRRYSAFDGLDGVSIAAGASLFIHYNDDAMNANEIDISTIGGNFAPLEREAYGLQLYVNSSFSLGSAIADHLQWSLNGIDNISADDRSDEAETGGVWEDQSQWIATESDSLIIELTDTSGGILHSPTNYNVTSPVIASVNVPLLPWSFAMALFAALGCINLYYKLRMIIR